MAIGEFPLPGMRFDDNVGWYWPGDVRDPFRMTCNCGCGCRGDWEQHFVPAPPTGIIKGRSVPATPIELDWDDEP